MKELIIVDTNVAKATNGLDVDQASLNCIEASIDALGEVIDNRICLVDSEGLILKEYLAQKPHGSPRGAGDAFMVWVNDNLYHTDYCRRVKIHPIKDQRRQFEEFPEDPDLSGFDLADRKFVAVVIASGESPKILNATDSDWEVFQIPLEKHGVKVVQLCL